MTTAIDTNILLDVLIPGEPFSETSKSLLDHYLSKGRLVICEVVFAELAAVFPSSQELDGFLGDTGIGLVYSNRKALFLAGSRWANYSREKNRRQISCSACGHLFTVDCPRCSAGLLKRRHVLSDFFIGAHALAQADCLLSRDLGIYRTYFSELEVVGSV